MEQRQPAVIHHDSDRSGPHDRLDVSLPGERDGPKWQRERLVAGRAFIPRRTQQSSSSITYHGTWHSVGNANASGGSLKYATAAGASAGYTFTGSSIAWVAYKGPNRGSAKVYIDGVYAATVSLYKSSYVSRSVVYAMSSGSNGSHTIKIVVVGTAGHPRVDLDAFVRLYQL